MDWQTWDKKKLDLEYSPSRWSKRGDTNYVINNFIEKITQASEEAKSKIPCQINVPYGESSEEKMDIFGLENLPDDAPIFVFIHGGYWQMLSRSVSSVAVSPLYDSGIVCVTVGYDLAPNVSLDEIVDQIVKAVCSVLNMAKQRQSRGVIIAGHSAGSHLTAMLLHSARFQQCPNISYLKAMMHVSGVFDLQPLVNTYVNEPLKLDIEKARKLSPASLPVLEKNNILQEIVQFFAVAEDDPPEFHRQAQEYSQLLKRYGFRTELHTVPDTDHFSIIEQMNDKDFVLTRLIRNFSEKI